MSEEIVEKVRNYVEEECKKSTSKYGYEPYLFHFTPVVNYAKLLAIRNNANVEIVELAGWLHDIGSIVNGRKDHHISGSEIAEKKLREFAYPEEKIAQVKRCILNHRGSQKNEINSIEEQIIADADAMSNFDNLPGIFKAAFIFENLDQGEAKISVRNKLSNKFNQLSPQSKEIIKPRYEAAMLLLK